MPKYRCLNKKCKDYNKVKWSDSITKLVKGEILDTAIPCPNCGISREFLTEDGMTTHMYGSNNICKR